jgi:hypothetical protein
MGLFSRPASANESSSAPTARGVFEVIACSYQQFGATMADSWWAGVVSGPGIAPVAVTHTGMAPQDKMTRPGQVVPVDLDPADFARFDILLPSAHPSGATKPHG